jgi:hypothetical protein
MANIFSSMANNFGDWLGQKIAPYINDALGNDYTVLGRYYTGDQRKPLKTKAGQQDENIIQNFTGLAVDRSVSRLFKGGIKFILPDGATAQQEYLDAVWDLNKKEILLYQVGLHGAIYGTSYFKICPDELVDSYTMQPYPKLVAIDPEIIRIKTEPDDLNDVEQYEIRYSYVKEIDGRSMTVGVRELYRHATQADTEAPEAQQAPDTWVIDEYEQIGGMPEQLVLSTPWPYDFPPIVHWKNLPSLKTCYGSSDIDDSINIQDKSNFVVSNTGKIIKFYASPETIGTGFSVSQMQKLDSAVGSFHAIPAPDAKVYNLEMNSDLASSRAFALDLRQSIFDISREVDISSMADKLGALTNFGLQVLWSDAIDKNNTKRQLYGDAILELNRRLLVLNGMDGEASRPGTIQWGDALPINVMEEMTADKMAIELGVIDKETVAGRYFSRYGKTWEDIEKAVEEQQQKANQQNGDIGSMILKNFSQGQGANVPPMMKRQQQQQEMNANPNATSKETAQ